MMSTVSTADVALRKLIDSLGPGSVHREDVERLFERHRVNSTDREAISVALFRDAMTAYADDDQIDDQEHEDLGKLRVALDISSDEVLRAESDILYPRYRELVRFVLADQEVTQDERERLAQFAKHLRLSPLASAQIFGESAGRLLGRVLSDAISDRILSPEEFREYALIAKAIGIVPQHDQATDAILHRCALRWRIQNGDFPIVNVDIALRPDEVCHLRVGAVWQEMRLRGRGEAREKYLFEIDRGSLFVTNQRMIFNGTVRNVVFRYSDLMKQTAYADGVSLEKATGRRAILSFEGDTEIAVAITMAAARRYKGVRA